MNNTDDFYTRVKAAWAELGGDDFFTTDKTVPLWKRATFDYWGDSYNGGIQATVDVQAGPYARRRWASNLSCVVKYHSKHVPTTDSQITEKLRDLQARARAVDNENKTLARQQAHAQREFQLRQDAARKEWIRKIRLSFGGSPDKQLDETHAPKVLDNNALLRAEHNVEFVVSLPHDLDERASFLAALDGFLASRLTADLNH